ncbi:MAG TPA: hypothetical protein VIC27_00640, partial [Ktedonobacterales bacterium]
RKLCPLLIGSIEGAAIRSGEQAQVREETCMRKGAPACTFAIRFMRPSGASGPSHTSSAPAASAPWHSERWEAQRRLADAVYTLLPDADGVTLSEVQDLLKARFPQFGESARPFVVLEAINHLNHAGWVATSANEPGDALGARRYWRAPRSGN